MSAVIRKRAQLDEDPVHEEKGPRNVKRAKANVPKSFDELESTRNAITTDTTTTHEATITKTDTALKSVSRDDTITHSDDKILVHRKQRAVSITDFKEPLKLIDDHPVPKLEDHDVLVSNRAVGLNPIDWKGKKYGFGIYHFPWINGRESSGVVLETGSQVDKHEFKPGDRVIVSSTSYRDNRTSTFQQYTAIDSRLVWKLPPHFTFEDGATIGVGLVTAGVLFYKSFGFDLSTTVKKANGTLLLWGGSTVMGIYTAQFAKIHGLKVIAVAGLNHKEYLQNELGVDHVIDRHLPQSQIIEQALSAESDIKYGIDCVSKDTASAVVQALAQGSSRLTTNTKPLFSGIVGNPKEIPPEVELREVVIKQFHEDVQFGQQFVQVTKTFLDDHRIKPAKYKAYKGGLHLIDDALKDLEKIGARGEKYVVSI